MTDLVISSHWLNLRSSTQSPFRYLFNISDVARDSIYTNPFSDTVAFASSKSAGSAYLPTTEFISVHRFDVNGFQFCPGTCRPDADSLHLGIFIYSEKRLIFRTLKTVFDTDTYRLNMQGVHRMTEQYADTRLIKTDDIVKNCKMLNLQGRDELRKFYNSNEDNVLFIIQKINVFDGEQNNVTHVLNTKTLELVEL